MCISFQRCIVFSHHHSLRVLLTRIFMQPLLYSWSPQLIRFRHTDAVPADLISLFYALMIGDFDLMTGGRQTHLIWSSS